jgi:hypothetical protein
MVSPPARARLLTPLEKSERAVFAEGGAVGGRGAGKHKGCVVMMMHYDERAATSRNEGFVNEDS